MCEKRRVSDRREAGSGAGAGAGGGAAGAGLGEDESRRGVSNEAGSGASAGQDELARRDRLERLAGFEPYVRRRGALASSTGAGRLSDAEEALLELEDEDEDDKVGEAEPWRKARSEKARSGTAGEEDRQ